MLTFVVISWIVIGLLQLFALFGNLYLLGKPRQPLTPGVAAFNMGFILYLIVVIICTLVLLLS